MQSEYDVCYPVDPCGWNNHCAKDLLNGDLWCICKIGTDKDGNCVGKYIVTVKIVEQS